MKRRDFLASSLGLVAAGALPACSDHGESNLPQPPAPAVGPDGKRRIPWSNWSGYRHCLPQERATPETEDELAELLRKSRGTIRPVGAGHSFTELVPTDGTLVSLRHFTGIKSVDPAALTATVGAGTRLGELGELLHQAGQALPNMPDVDEQTLAGAMATATHGTGQGLGALHAYVESVRLVTPRGEVLVCSRQKNPQVFEAARVSLGALGVITEMTLRNVPARNLKRRVWLEPLDDLLDRFDELAAKHHSFEMYYLPFFDYGVAISIDPTDVPPQPRGAEQDNDAVMQMKSLRDLLEWWPGARRWLLNKSAGDFRPEESVDAAHRVFPSSREVRFHEMEYHLPREHLVPTLRKVRQILESHHPEIFFPVELRVVKGDDAWLSPFHGHATSGSIAVHHYHREDPLSYFASIEPLYRPLGGRPHWGKMNTLGAADFAALYPRWKDFLEVRATLDPEGKMLNPHLRKVFGL